MRRLLLAIPLMLLVACQAAVSQGSFTPNDPPASGYTLAFNDEFDGTAPRPNRPCPP
jgi:hypothetical protein